jgi:broad specificity phosphatase PhoE
MKVVYLVRHGQAIDDIENLFGGAADHPPTKKALKEAEIFADKFNSRGVQLVITSPYQRARIPAEIVSKNLGVAMEIVEDLKERNTYGILTGMNKDEAAKKYPEMVEALKKPASQIEGAELNSFFRKRAQKAAEEIWQRPEETILVFTHMGPILAILDLHFLDLEAENYGWLKLTKEKGKWKILESEKVIFNKELI